MCPSGATCLPAD